MDRRFIGQMHLETPLDNGGQFEASEAVQPGRRHVGDIYAGLKGFYYYLQLHM